jgi:hypothetical protein
VLPVVLYLLLMQKTEKCYAKLPEEQSNLQQFSRLLLLRVCPFGRAAFILTSYFADDIISLNISQE